MYMYMFVLQTEYDLGANAFRQYSTRNTSVLSQQLSDKINKFLTVLTIGIQNSKARQILKGDCKNT